jgi:hypothetical protein
MQRKNPLSDTPQSSSAPHLLSHLGAVHFFGSLGPAEMQ